MRKLSVALAVFNESENLARCLDSIKLIADEIIIVDGGSTDNTVEIAKKYTQNVIITSNPPIFHINKQKAIDACHEEWILQLDADEEVSKELGDEIFGVVRMSDSERELYKIPLEKERLFHRHQKNIEERDGIKEFTERPIVGYYLPRRNFFLGKAMTYAGMYPDGVIRLFKNGKGYFPSESVHEQIHIEGRVNWLQHDLFHYSNPTFARYKAGAEKYTNLLVEEMKKEKKSNGSLFWSYGVVKPTVTFFSLFICHKGILDGVHGFLFSFFSALHFPLALWKYMHRFTTP